jgi:hypothetical protein
VQRLIYDGVADSDPLRRRVADDQFELICPHRKSRKRLRSQDDVTNDATKLSALSVE